MVMHLNSLLKMLSWIKKNWRNRLKNLTHHPDTHTQPVHEAILNMIHTHTHTHTHPPFLTMLSASVLSFILVYYAVLKHCYLLCFQFFICPYMSHMCIYT